jgi:RNA polymerase sigma factor (TIGR02999 family)
VRIAGGDAELKGIVGEGKAASDAPIAGNDGGKCRETNEITDEDATVDHTEAPVGQGLKVWPRMIRYVTVLRVDCNADIILMPQISALMTDSNVTQMLREWRAGDAAAGERLLPIVYAELHRRAAAAMRREDDGHTLQATAVVHEAYMRLVDQRGADWQNRSQFYGVAAQMMRRVLIDHAREHLAAKRGGGAKRVTLSGVDVASDSDEAIEVLALHDALEKLAVLDERQAKVVELRYFGGLSVEETAEALEISAATVKREWATARAWLKRELAASR